MLSLADGVLVESNVNDDDDDDANYTVCISEYCKIKLINKNSVSEGDQGH